MALLEQLGLALALGLLVGLERGWQERHAEEGARIAGLRTFGLISLLGGLWALLSEQFGAVLLGFAFLTFVLLVLVSHFDSVKRSGARGLTTVVATLVTFTLGALTVAGYEVVASAAAVVVTVLLGLKPVLHAWLARLRQEELYAVYKLLLISVVLLPVLPNQGFGPWQILNPYEIWWMVVLIAGVSFIGYFAVRIAGTGRGILLTALSAGLVSSTALTLHFSRIARANPRGQRLLSAGIAFAAATMFPRLLLVVGIIHPSMALYLLFPAGLMGIIVYGGGYWLWRGAKRQSTPHLVLDNPCDLGMAVKFGGLLALVILAAHALKEWFGEIGLYVAAGISGISDVDAISLTLARMAQEDSQVLAVAAIGIFLAAMVNTLVKGGLAWGIGGSRFGLPLLGIFLLSIVVGGGSLLMWSGNFPSLELV
ncbi:membrane protein [Nitrosococcus oceani ATCC 19707]|uniref:Membrane protein n=2 Tax=Nitrosococcus oceani TaxID=1229 RepID=Q3J880_NITOC|nr:MgtC/SapB family protein [Nitrosococcus oceani]ABA58966.1 membrane protein [Nitrosococcus oceani ATCC 19707]EDZ65311.1 hypothetical protein NOC27_1989 [Nitrosococcus oceani AFC27]KFI18588.1 membrane protein [Nitrosococcus oceani C-27]GEM18938.1 membrane protein [Nitrosococcus oceani]